MKNSPSKDPEYQFSFKPTTETYVHKVISNFNIKKSTGVDKYLQRFLRHVFQQLVVQSRPL